MLKHHYQSPYEKIKSSWSSPQTTVYLIRHCAPEKLLVPELGDTHIPLSTIGLKQRTLLTKRLASLKIDKIYSSEYTRAIETAKPLAVKATKQIIIDDRLNEIDWQDWYKVKYFHMTEQTREKKLLGYKKMDRELNKYQGRIRRVLADICRHSKGKRVAVFCHGNVIRTAITSILNADIIGFLSMEVYQSSVSKLTVDKAGYIKINYVNNITHLPHHTDEDIFRAALNQ